MATTNIYVYVYLPGEYKPTPAGMLKMIEDGRDSYATFRYGQLYLQKNNCIPVDAISLPLHSHETQIVYRTEEGFKLFNGIRDASPDGWGSTKSSCCLERFMVACKICPKR